MHKKKFLFPVSVGETFGLVANIDIPNKIPQLYTNSLKKNIHLRSTSITYMAGSHSIARGITTFQLALHYILSEKVFYWLNLLATKAPTMYVLVNIF